MKQAVVALIRKQGRVLVIRRGPAARLPGYWGPLSGTIEDGETQAEAVVREVWEEVGLEVRPVAKAWECPTDDGTYKLHWWTVELLGGELKADDGEVADVRWVTREEFLKLEPTFRGDVEFFETVLPRL